MYYFWEEGKEKKTKKLVVPQLLKDDILRQLHESLTAGHLGEKKTYDRVKERFFWYKYREFVERWCKQCDSCAARKMSTKKRVAPMQQFLRGCPFERISIDILGPLPRSRRGNQYILVLADHFTKWTEAIPMPRQEARTVARNFLDHFIFGMSYEIMSDQRTQFESELFKELCELLGTDKTRTTGYHPSSNGLVERLNCTSEGMISHNVSEDQRDCSYPFADAGI